MKDEFSLCDWLRYVENLHVKSVDLELDRVRDIAIKLDLLHPAKTVVLVGGTNGKGTTCCLLETILLANGMSVGVYTSPHLLSYTERLRVNGKELEESDHIKAMYVIEDFRASNALTYFEFTTLANLFLLKNRDLEVVILEVGVGGRLDATNIVDPDISIVTNVAIDHIDLLGSSYMGIAKEKFGIFRVSRPAIVGDFNYPNILREVICDWYGAIPFLKNEDWWFYTETDQWFWKTKNYSLSSLPIPKIPIENAALVLSAISFFSFTVSRKLIDHALSTVVLPGRFQIISVFPYIILDVAHNPHAAVYLLKFLRKINILGVFRIVIGMLINKDIFNTVRVFDDLKPIWYVTSLNCCLGASASQITDCIRSTNSSCIYEFVDVCDAFRQALLEAYQEDCIVVFGSFHTVSPVLRLISKNSKKNLL